MSDERLNLPSSSGLHRLSACPGSFKLERGLLGTSSPESESGTRIHDYLALKLPEDALSPEEQDIAASCLQIEEKVLAQWKARLSIPEDAAIECHRDLGRVWLERDGEKIFSGSTDTVYVWERNALVLDYKTGRSTQADAAENLQLRSYAVLVVHKFGWLKSVEVCVVQPLHTHSPTPCHYDVDDLIESQKELFEILDASNSPTAPLRTGDHCNFCRAASICPAVRAEVTQLSSLTIHENGLSVSDEDMATLRDKCGAAKKMISAIEAECFRRAQDDPAKWESLGWIISEGSGRRAVEDTTSVCERLNAAGASWPDISAEVSLTIGAVEKLARAATNKKGKALKNEVDSILDGCCEIKKAAPSLKRLNSPEE